MFKARLLQIDGLPAAAVLVWNADSTHSSVLLLSLQNGAILGVLREADSRDKFKKNLHLLECSEQYVFVGSLRGDVSIYNLQLSEKKVGLILHNSLVGDLICSRLEMQATGVTVRLLYVLERRSQESEGSFAIYLLQ